MRKTIFQKYAGNPVLSAKDFPAEVMYVLNPGAVRFGNEYILLCDAALGSTAIVFWMAHSRDGIHFKPEPRPVEWPGSNPPEGCVYDPRITRFGDEYVLMYASHRKGTNGPRIGVVKTYDFQTFTRIPQCDSGIPNRNAVLFPEKIQGRYVRFDRPMSTGELGAAGMCVSFSDDLSNWYGTRPLMEPRSGNWDSHKIGGAAVPVRTDEGWLVIYHGVDNSSCNNFIYRLGVMLLDLENPLKIIARSPFPVLWPEKPYEFFGRTPNVVFSCNALLESNGMLRMYYGAADSCIGLAEADLRELIEFCRKPDFLGSRFFSFAGTAEPVLGN